MNIVAHSREIRNKIKVVLGYAPRNSSIDFRTHELNRWVVIDSTNKPPSQIASLLFVTKIKKKRCTKLLISIHDKI